MNDILILGIIFVSILVLIIICTRKKPKIEEPKTEPIQQDTSKCIRANGIDIKLTEEDTVLIEQQKKEEEHKAFVEFRDSLVAAIRCERDATKDIVKRKVLEQLLLKKVETVEDLAELDFLYNDGKLRSNEEVEFRKRYIAMKEKRENFDKERHSVNLKAFIYPFIFTFIITCLIVHDILIGPVLGLLFGFIAAYIGMIFGYTENIDNAREYCIPEDDPRLVNEINKRKAAVIAGIASIAAVGHHTKKAVKDFVNVDGWEEMK